MGIKVVGFKDGTFGVRKGSWLFGYTYLDFTTQRMYWWDIDSQFHERIRTDSYAKAFKIARSISDKGSPCNGQPYNTTFNDVEPEDEPLIKDMVKNLVRKEMKKYGYL